MYSKRCLLSDILICIVVISFGYTVDAEGSEKKVFDEWRKSMNVSVDPCNDFARFMCSRFTYSTNENWLRSLRTFGESYDPIEECSKDSLINNKETNSTAVKKMRFYRDRKWTKREAMPDFQLIDEIWVLGGCPLFDPNWSSSNYNFTHALHFLTKSTGMMPLFSFNIISVSSTSTLLKLEPEQRALELCSHLLGDDKQESLNATKAMEEAVLSQLEFMVQKLGRFVKYPREYPKQQVKQYVEIFTHHCRAIQTFNVSKTLEKELDRYGAALSYNISKLEKIQFNEIGKLLPLFGKDYFLNSHYVLPEVRDYLLTNPYVYVANKQFFVEMNAYYSKLDMETLSNYLCIKYINYMIEYTTFDYKKVLSAETLKELENLPLFDSGLERYNKALNTFKYVVDHLFIQQCVKQSELVEAQKMAWQVRWAAEKMINEAEWLDEKTKELAINKLHHMKQTIGASNISINVQQLDEYYGNLNFLDRDSARDLYVKIIMFQRQKDLLKCAKPETYDEVAERYRSSTNNCFYSFKNNQFDIFDAYIEFSNFYKSNVPAVVKFGKMGFVIGHETFHSFTTGIQFDENGNRSDWFDSRSMEQFHERAKCFTDQYSAIKDLTTGINLNGTRTFSENLPDHAGLRASYFAFKQFNDEWNSTSAMQTDYTPTQLFFMSYGAAWCKKYSTGQQQYIIITDPHSPNEYRINEVLKNVPEFAEAFKCAAGTKMNPNKRCKIW